MDVYVCTIALFMCVFCKRECVLMMLGDKGDSCCPVCHMPAWVKDVRSDCQMSDLVEAVSSLKLLLETPSGSPLATCSDGFSRRKRKGCCPLEDNSSSTLQFPKAKRSHLLNGKDYHFRQRGLHVFSIFLHVLDSIIYYITGPAKRNIRGETQLHVATLKVINIVTAGGSL